MWDVYCGAGGIGLSVAAGATKLVGFDIQKEKVDMVNAGDNYIGDVVNEKITWNVAHLTTANFLHCNVPRISCAGEV